jgi:hypothetical protein
LANERASLSFKPLGEAVEKLRLKFGLLRGEEIGEIGRERFGQAIKFCR